MAIEMSDGAAWASHALDLHWESEQAGSEVPQSVAPSFEGGAMDPGCGWMVGAMAVPASSWAVPTTTAAEAALGAGELAAFTKFMPKNLFGVGLGVAAWAGYAAVDAFRGEQAATEASPFMAGPAMPRVQEGSRIHGGGVTVLGTPGEAMQPVSSAFPGERLHWPTSYITPSFESQATVYGGPVLDGVNRGGQAYGSRAYRDVPKVIDHQKLNDLVATVDSGVRGGVDVFHINNDRLISVDQQSGAPSAVCEQKISAECLARYFPGNVAVPVSLHSVARVDGVDGDPTLHPGVVWRRPGIGVVGSGLDLLLNPQDASAAPNVAATTLDDIYLITAAGRRAQFLPGPGSGVLIAPDGRASIFPVGPVVPNVGNAIDAFEEKWSGFFKGLATKVMGSE